MAEDLFSYIDDHRPTAPSVWECWCALRKICCSLIRHELQDAGRKKNGRSQSPGEVAATMVETVDGKVVLLVSQKKWDRSEFIVKRIQDELLLKGCLDFKQLERDRCFLIYLTRTYKSMYLYFKGIYQTLDSWKEGRDEDGWKLTRQDLMSESLGKSNYYEKEASSVVEPASRLKDDLFALKSMLEGDVIRRSPIRLSKSGWVSYGIGDTPGNGYGAAVHIGEKLHYMYEQWTSVESEQTSNYRELHNLVNTVGKLYKEGFFK